MLWSAAYAAPPPDCFAGPHPTCTASPPPGSLLHDPWITTIVHDITNISQLFRNGRGIIEHLQAQTRTVKGTQPSADVNGNPFTSIFNDLSQLLKDIHDQHPVAPTAPSPVTSGKTHQALDPTHGAKVTEDNTPQTATGGSGSGQRSGGSAGIGGTYEPQDTGGTNGPDNNSNAPEDTSSTIDVLRSVVTETRGNLIRDPSLAQNVLTTGEQAATMARPWLTRMTFGKALERLVANDPRVTDLLTHVGGAGNPDFVDASGLGYEVTTSNPFTVAAHLLRGYVDSARLATYDPIPGSFRFNFG